MNQWSNKSAKTGRVNVTLRNWLILITVAAVIVGAYFFITNLGKRQEPTAKRLNAYANQKVTPFGEYVVYYDGVSIHCLTHSGSVRWSLAVGEGADFSVSGHNLVAWVNTQMYILDYSGKPTYQDTLGDQVQFARIGSKYAAAVVGQQDTSPTLIVRDLRGTQVDQESEAFRDAMLLDVGFYGDQGQYMWTTMLDVYSNKASVTLKTFEVGKKNTGESFLDEETPYRVLFENNRLRAITTRKIRTYNYQGIENATDSMLVYGWRLIDSEIPPKGDAMMLFAPTAQTGGQFSISELRLLAGTTDRRFTLPSSCVGAVVYNKAIYAFSSQYIYRAEANAQRFNAYELPIKSAEITQVLGTLEGGRALLACGDDVYVITLPGV